MVNDLVEVVNTKVVHLDEVLDEVQRTDRVWFKIGFIERLKVGMMMKKSQVTISICELENPFIFIMIWFFLILLMWLSVKMV